MLVGQPAAAERVSLATAGHGAPAQPGPVVRWQVQREERAVKDTQRGARRVRSQPSLRRGPPAIAILLAANPGHTLTQSCEVICHGATGGLRDPRPRGAWHRLVSLV